MLYSIIIYPYPMEKGVVELLKRFDLKRTDSVSTQVPASIT